MSALAPTAPRKRITPNRPGTVANSFDAYRAPSSLGKTAPSRLPPRVRAAATRTPSPLYTHVSSHIRSRHRSSGIDVPVNSGQK
ncbi:hypothetical protein EES43_11200 [Streptomyces sp. ADI96-02]|nr:hypothetical protein EES43_11200 [Streptomyces sp. ADI96-02]